jgi:hypothetical protein
LNPLPQNSKRGLFLTAKKQLRETVGDRLLEGFFDYERAHMGICPKKIKRENIRVDFLFFLLRVVPLLF